MLRTQAPHEIINPRQHKRQENGEYTAKTYECPTCDYVGAEIQHLLKHRQMKNKCKQQWKKEGSKKWACQTQQCEQTFDTKKNSPDITYTTAMKKYKYNQTKKDYRYTYSKKQTGESNYKKEYQEKQQKTTKKT